MEMSDYIIEMPPPISITPNESGNLGEYERVLAEIYSKTTYSENELASLYLPEKLSPVDLANRLRVPLKSNVLQDIDLSLTPYLIDPISLIGDPISRFIAMIAPTQSGKTVFLQVAVAHTIDQNPGTLIYILPDENNGKAAMKEKIIGMIEETDWLMAHVTKKMSVTKIELDNMTIWPGWAGSLGTLSSKPAKVIILDEVRLMPLTIKQESNAIKLAEDRLTTFAEFGQANCYVVSTPSVKGDLIYSQMEVRGTLTVHWMVKCKDCYRHFQADFFKHMKWDIGADDAFIQCPFCKNKLEEGKHKRILNSSGGYGTNKMSGAKELPSIKSTRQERMVFRFDSLVSPFRSTHKIVTEFYRTKGIISDYKNFWQGWLAKFWENDVSKTSEKGLKSRIKKGHIKGDVPLGTKFLTAGVDCQDDGFYVTVFAWVGEKECYLVDGFKIEIDMHQAAWKKVRETLKLRLDERTWNGWAVCAWGIDVGDTEFLRLLMDATSEFTKCYRIVGKVQNQTATIVYKKDTDTYRINKDPYLEETEKHQLTDQFHLYENIEDDFILQYIGARKTEEIHPKTGLTIVVWKKVGQNDYRMAAVYAYECLDFTIFETFTLRDMLNKDGYINNPAIKRIKVKTTKISESTNSGIPDYKPMKTSDYWEDIL